MVPDYSLAFKQAKWMQKRNNRQTRKRQSENLGKFGATVYQHKTNLIHVNRNEGCIKISNLNRLIRS